MADSDDDAWLEQLREALASTAGDDASGTEDDPFATDAPAPGPSAHPGPTAQPTTEVPPPAAPGAAPQLPARQDAPTPAADDLARLLDAVASLGDRLRAVESATQELARDARRTAVPDINQVEGAVTRALRAELPGMLDARMGLRTSGVDLPSAEESLERWAERVDLAGAPTGEVVVLVNELHQRIAELEALHRRALEELTGDRRQLIDEAVDEIRKLLFGE